MEDRKLMFRLITITIFHLLTSSLAASPYECAFSLYGSTAYYVRFPFRMFTQQPDISDYPGFEINCSKQGMTLLNLLNAGNFSVGNIDYRAQVDQNCDSSGCIASRLDIWGSPFSATPIRNYTLLSCLVEVAMSRCITICCVSNTTYSILATFSESFIRELTKRNTFRITDSFRSPISRYQDKKGLTFDLNIGISLARVADGETCGNTNSTTREIASDENNKNGNKKTMIAFIIISIVLALPAIAASIVMDCRDDRRVVTWIPATDATAMIAETTTISHIGLDQLTIESYTKVILVESRRLTGHDDAVCAICLSEYDVKDTVRCIPECRHCFHADCIAEWLKMKGTCPICRTSPSPALVINL